MTGGDPDLATSAGDPLPGIIGTQLRRLRTQSELSLDRLSKLARVSRGMLSQIELGRSAPTITVLSRIAAALSVPVATFLTAETTSVVTLMRREDAQVLRRPDGLFTSRALFPFHGTRRTEFYELQLQKGCRHASPAHAAGTTENLVVASGRLHVELGGAVHELGAGDALFFHADAPHVYVNPGGEPATVYLVMGYPESVSY